MRCLEENIFLSEWRHRHPSDVIVIVVIQYGKKYIVRSHYLCCLSWEYSYIAVTITNFISLLLLLLSIPLWKKWWEKFNKRNFKWIKKREITKPKEREWENEKRVIQKFHFLHIKIRPLSFFFFTPSLFFCILYISFFNTL